MWKNKKVNKCKCGCQEYCKHSYIRGHNSRNRIVTWGDKISKTNKERCISPPQQFKYRKNHKPWNKDIFYHPNNYNTRFQKGQNKGKNNIKWKGNNVGYWGIHSWIYREKGAPKNCIKCGDTKNIQWTILTNETKAANLPRG